MILNIPLAWLQLSRKKTRLVVSLAGIAFAVVLMFMQLGFRDCVFDSATRIHRHLRGDLVVISSGSQALSALKSFPRRRLYQALGFNGVESAFPVYVSLANWEDPKTHFNRSGLVIGFNPEKPIFNLLDINLNLDKLKVPDVVFFNSTARSEFTTIATEFKQGRVIETELGNRKVKIGGLFSLGTSFVVDVDLVTSDLNFLRLFSNRQSDEIDIGLISLKPGADAQEIMANLITYLPKDIKVFTHQEFVEFEKNFWARSTAAGSIFNLGAMMGLIIGAVIVYQILYTDISEHFSEYATLKAMGYTDTYFLGVVFQEALILAILGYIPGFALSLGLYDFVATSMFLPIRMDFTKSLLVLVLTVFMCVISGAIAVRKVRSTDPCDIF